MYFTTTSLQSEKRFPVLKVKYVSRFWFPFFKVRLIFFHILLAFCISYFLINFPIICPFFVWFLSIYVLNRQFRLYLYLSHWPFAAVFPPWNFLSLYGLICPSFLCSFCVCVLFSRPSLRDYKYPCFLLELLWLHFFNNEIFKSIRNLLVKNKVKFDLISPQIYSCSSFWLIFLFRIMWNAHLSYVKLLGSVLGISVLCHLSGYFFCRSRCFSMIGRARPLAVLLIFSIFMASSVYFFETVASKFWLPVHRCRIEIQRQRFGG